MAEDARLPTNGISISDNPNAPFNIPSGMDVTFDGNERLGKEEQFLNAFAPIPTMLSGRTRLVNFEQPLNIPAGIVVEPDNKVMLEIFVE